MKAANIVMLQVTSTKHSIKTTRIVVFSELLAEKVLEILSCYGMLSRIKEETGTARVKKYVLTSLSKDLTREVSTDYLLFLTAPELMKIWLNTHESVLIADEVVFEKLYGNKLFQYLKEDVPELGRFHVSMMEKMSELQLEYLLEHYDKEFRSLKGPLVDVGGSQGGVAAAILLFLTAPELIKIWLNIHESVLNADEVVFEKLYGNKLFQYSKEDVPELGRFHVSMMEKMSELQLEYLLEHYDKEFGSLKGSLVDVGGSQGGVAAATASKYPNIQCVVNFDLPAVVGGAPEYRGVKHVCGSFLDFVPKGDMLFMKFVLLLWNDEDTVKLLRNCYDALPAKGKLGKLIMVERVHSWSRSRRIPRPGSAPQISLLTSLGTKGGKARALKQLRSAA